MCADHFYQREDTSDLDDFLAQLLGDTPEFLPTSIASSSLQLPPPPSASAPYLGSTTHHATDPSSTCQWVSSQNSPLVCGAALSSDPKHVCAHFRQAHNVRGNEKVTVTCHWRGCETPMQRGSLIRHLLSVHLGLLRWRCETCGKVFSRKGTWHSCADAEDK